MTDGRKIELFSAGCPLCDDAANLVEEIAGASHDVAVLNLNEAKVASRARTLGVRSAPAVAIDGELLDCCAGGGINERTLREGLEQPAQPKAENKHQRRGGCC